MEHAAAKKPGPRFNFRFTYNNYNEEGENKLKNWLKENCKYACFGHELAPTTGTPHLQGFFSLIKKSRITTIQKILQKRGIALAILKADASAEDNRKYCSKEDPQNFFECGDINLAGAGARTDLTEITCKIKDGTDIESIALDYSEHWVKYKSGFRDLHAIVKKRKINDERMVTVSVYFGASGTGKTKRCIDECKKMGMAPFICIHPNGDTLWFQNYNGELGLIIDDFYGWIKPAELYRYLDKYKCQIPYKGGYTFAEWTHVWITSNNPPDHWYSAKVKERMDSRALMRRLHNIERYEIDMTNEDNQRAVTSGAEYILPDIYIEKRSKPLALPMDHLALDMDEVDYSTPPIVPPPSPEITIPSTIPGEVSTSPLISFSDSEEEPLLDLNKS